MKQCWRNAAKCKAERANALWAAEFVGGEGEEVDAHIWHIYCDAPCGLNCVHMKEGAVFMGEGGDFVNGLNDACFIVHEHYGDERCFVVL